MKKVLLFILIVSAVFVLSVSMTGTALAEAANDIELALTSRTEGENCFVTVTLERNDGISGLRLRLEYDAALEVVDRTYGTALLSLDPLDLYGGAKEPFSLEEAYEDGEQIRPYRVVYLSEEAYDHENCTDEGTLFTLKLRAKEGAANGKYTLSLYVDQLLYYDEHGESTTNETYSSEEDPDFAPPLVGTTTYVVTNMAPAPEGKGGNALIIGLSVGGAVLFLGIAVAAYLLYRKKQNNSDNQKQ